MKKWKILIPSLVATASMPLVSLVGCGSKPSPTKRVSFNECDWDHIITACNNMYDGKWTNQDFLNCFYIDGDLTTKAIEPKNPTSLNDFVGQKRYVALDNINSPSNINATIKHEVIVIGMQQDYLKYSESENAFSQPVCFTFQFNNLLTNLAGNQVEYCWKEDQGSGVDNYDYWNSDIHNFLNSNVFNAFHETVLHDNIKTVKRLSNCQSDNIWSATIGDEKVFALNISDVFWTENFSEPDRTFLARENCHGNKQYKYYEDNIGHGSIEVGYSCLFRTTVGELGNRFAYWFTTPVRNSSGYAWGCYNSSERSTMNALIDFEHALAPCFCI